ncbi:MAG: SPOR domain-containing protein [Bacillota bacterium]|jgi:hypothetical protein
MHPRSRRSRQRRKKSNLIPALIISGILAILCGYIINSLLVNGYLWAPAIKDNPEPDPPQTEPDPDPEPPDPDPEVTSARLKIKGLTCYVLQVGALSSEANAQGLLQRLQQAGYPGAIRQEGELHKVSVGIFDNREAALAVREMLKDEDVDGFVREVSLEPGDWTINDARAGYFARLAEVVAELEALSAEMLRPGSINYDRGKAMQQQIEQAAQLLQSAQYPVDCQALQGQMVAATESLRQAISDLVQFLTYNDEQFRVLAESNLLEFVLNYQVVSQTLHEKF